MSWVESLFAAFTLALAIAFGSLLLRAIRRDQAAKADQSAWCEKRCAPSRPLIDEAQRCWCDRCVEVAPR